MVKLEVNINWLFVENREYHLACDKQCRLGSDLSLGDWGLLYTGRTIALPSALAGAAVSAKGESFLCDGQSIVRQAILDGNRSCTIS